MGLSSTRCDTSLEVAYIAYASPNGRFDTVQEIDLTVAHDDSHAWGSESFAGFRPAATLAFELQSQADGGRDRGAYAQLSSNPGCGSTCAGREAPPRKLPVIVGVGGYYENGSRDDTFGFVDVGVTVGGRLPLPTRFGAWSWRLGADLLWLGKSMEASNRGDSLEVLGCAVVALAF
ncbi:MAG: hypothetical protein R3F56_12355 [Planctomycetota bacterium]